MAENSKIQWTHHTFNPWRGCTKISPGCANCYAETMSHRNPRVLGIWGNNGTRVVASESMWREPVKWNREAKESGERKRVFCASLADVFEDRPELDATRQRLFDLILATPHLDWLVLTKRPEFAKHWLLGKGEAMVGIEKEYLAHEWGRGWPNVWLGCSVEDQARFNERVKVLTSIPAVVHFLSVEPQIGEVILGESIYQYHGHPPRLWEGGNVNWVIVGGESGAGARSFHLDWARSLVSECKQGGCAVFMKQLGGNPSFNRDESTLNLRDKKGGDINERPAGLRIREFPIKRSTSSNG